MRTGHPVGLAAIAALLLAPASLAADQDFDGVDDSLDNCILVWTGTTGAGTPGSSAIVVSDTSPETLTLDVRIDADAAGVSLAWVSLEFDLDLQTHFRQLFLETDGVLRT